MDTAKAYEAVRRYRDRSVLSDEEEFIYTEALNYMIEATGNTAYMVELGGYYYGRKDYDQAIKYYEMADEHGDPWAPEGLGYIWYYGRTGKVDYEKAFFYYSKAAKNGYARSEIKVADMYKNGYFVERQYDKYCAIIEGMVKRMRHPKDLGEPYPEVCTRLAKIRKDEGKPEEAVTLYLDAKDFLRQRIRYTRFFGDLNIMKWLIEDLYELIPFDEGDFDLYDLYHLLKKPHTVSFRYWQRTYEIQSEEAEGYTAIRFGDRWYRTAGDFLANAAIGNELLITLDEYLYEFEVLE